MKEYNFVATNSGDGQSFCFDVDRETFINVMGREPNDFDDFQSGDYSRNSEGELEFTPHNENKCRIYPNSLFGGSYKKIEVELKVKLL